MKRNPLRVLLCLALVLLLSAEFVPAAFGADSTFEKSISAFPESYRVKLRELHKIYPEWEFQAMDTGLNWNDAVNVESSGGRSLIDVYDSYSDVFKSKNTGDYNYSSGRYIQKDGGFCTANKYCVSYFMDPRNFLNEENIFQFELLRFDDSFTVDSVDLVLSGTFMYNKKITYVTSSGASKTMNQTYAEVIYEAGEMYDINPCYLASKIRNEIGSTPSGSVTGRNSSYPGIYNFYNIGASDGAGAITRGLAWAAGRDGTYHRPWTTPKKSIVGGAEYIASTYIGKGQFTGYYQRFNVNPDSYYSTYEHQYMTNVSGATIQGYSAYRSYLSMGLLEGHFIFSIPVYRNMPGAANNKGTLKLADAASQTVTVSTDSAINVRTGPSTNYDRLGFTLARGTKLTVLGTYATDSRYFDSILRYPFWYYVKFKYDGTAYKGYVPAGFTSVTTTKTVAPGLYAPKYSTTNKSLYFKYVSMDARICSVVDDTKLKFLKTGTCNVMAYDSTGRYAMVKYKVSSSAGPNPTEEQPVELDSELGKVDGLRQTNVTQTGFTLSWNAVSGAKGYRVLRYHPATDETETLTTTKKTAFTLKDLAPGSTMQLTVMAYTKENGETIWGEASEPLQAMTVPNGPEAVSQSKSTSNSVTMTWSGVEGAKSYQLVRYDEARDDFVSVKITKGNAGTASGLSAASSYWLKVRAIVSIGGKDYYTPYSLTLTAKTGPAQATGLKQTAATTNSVSLAWNAAAKADSYIVCRVNESNGELTEIGRTSATSYTVQGLSSGASAVYTVKSSRVEDEIDYDGTKSNEVLGASKPVQVTGLQQYSTKSTCLKLKWNAVHNAEGYCVYRVSDTGSYKKVATVTDNKALVKSLSPATSYDFVVRAYIRANGTVYWGDYSDTLRAKTNPSK